MPRKKHKPTATQKHTPDATTASKSQKGMATSYYFFFNQYEDGGWMSNFYLKTFRAPDPAQWLPIKEKDHAPAHDVFHPTYSDPVQTIEFHSGEQYFQYCKALQFRDANAATKILETETPRECKTLAGPGHIKGFNDEEWNLCKLQAMEETVWWKFGGGELTATGDLSTFDDEESLGHWPLERTSDKILIEAAPNDSCWGIGYNARNAMKYLQNWGGNNLGETLMRVRVRLKELVEDLQGDQSAPPAHEDDTIEHYN